MIFGDVPVGEAEGAILVHSVRATGVSLSKGRVLSSDDLRLLADAGIERVTIARLEEMDVPEDEAATQIAAVAAGAEVDRSAAFTGRANLFAACDGLAMVDRDRLDRFNLLHESLTIATVSPFERVRKGQMIATVKIIPFAAERVALESGVTLLSAGGPLVRVAPFRDRTVGVISTSLPGGKDSLADKNIKVLAERLAALGEHQIIGRQCPHRPEAVAEHICELISSGYEPVFIFGASAIVDRRDVVPAGIVAAGGEILHFGMPVDPGNLLLLGRVGQIPVIGLPGCARSPKLNGFDWVLQRLLADIPVTSEDIMRMGAGGLLKEIPSRPQPRAGGKPGVRTRPQIAAIVLAAGQSRRMGAHNKLLIELEGQPLVRHVVSEVTRSKAGPVIVITGHEAGDVRAALEGLPIEFADNPTFADGLSSSLAVGLRALSDAADGVLICLADMPALKAAHLDKLIAAFDPDEGREICVPTYNGKRGNPVLFGRRFFAEMMAVSGDVGARHLIGEYSELVCEVAIDDPAILLDLDTPRAVADYKAEMIR